MATKRITTTALGKKLDFDKLRMKNPTTVAIGNTNKKVDLPDNAKKLMPARSETPIVKAFKPVHTPLNKVSKKVIKNIVSSQLENKPTKQKERHQTEGK